MKKTLFLAALLSVVSSFFSQKASAGIPITLGFEDSSTNFVDEFGARWAQVDFGPKSAEEGFRCSTTLTPKEGSSTHVRKIFIGQDHFFKTKISIHLNEKKQLYRRGTC